MSFFRPLLIVALSIGLGAAAGCASRRGSPELGPAANRQPSGTSVEEAAVSSDAGPAELSPAEQAALVRGFQQAAGERVFFVVDRDDLTEEAQAVLAAQAAWLRRHPQLRVLIAGHADERGTREYNLGLGARRANAVRTHLMRAGVAPERLGTTSYGKERPLDAGVGEAAWARNRNAHSVLVDLVLVD